MSDNRAIEREFEAQLREFSRFAKPTGRLRWRLNEDGLIDVLQQQWECAGAVKWFDIPIEAVEIIK